MANTMTQLRKIYITDASTGKTANVNADNQLHVVLMGTIDADNSTSTLLNADAVFTGGTYETLDFGYIFVTMFSDVASATDGLSFQQSSDGTNWDNTDDYNYVGGTGKIYSIQPGARYFRVVYTNGNTNQGTFRLQTVFKKTSSLSSSHRISDNLSPEDDGTLGIAIIKGQKPNGDYTDFNATTAGNFKVSLEEFETGFVSNPLPTRDPLLEISRGNVTGMSGVTKFGRNIEIDSSVTADIWDGGHTVSSGGVSLIWVAPTAARIHTIASTSANDDTGGTGANSIKISYLPDWDTVEATETVTGDLNAGIAMNNAAVIIHRMEVIIQSTSTTINAGVITATAATDNTVTAQIRVGQGQTQMSIYGVPSTQTLKMGRLYANVNKAGGAAGLLDITLLANTAPDINTVPFLIKHTFGLQTVGTSAFSIPYYVPKQFSGPIIIKIQAESNTNGMDVSAGFDFVLINN